MFDDLYENARERLAEHMAKRTHSSASMFRPSVTKLADSMRRDDATPAHEHLYRQHAERESKLAAIREAEAASVTFSPQVNHKSAMYVASPRPAARHVAAGGSRCGGSARSPTAIGCTTGWQKSGRGTPTWSACTRRTP